MRRLRNRPNKSIIEGITFAVITIIMILNFGAHQGAGAGSLGQILWEYNLPTTGYNFALKMAIGDVDGDGNKEIVVARSQEVRCLSNAGTLKWASSISISTPSTPVLVQARIGSYQDIIVYGDNNSICLYGNNGSVKWQDNIPGIILDSHSAADFDSDGITDLIVATVNNRLTAISCNNGSIKWTSLASMNASSPLIVDSPESGKLDIFAGSANGNLSCLYAGNGSSRWSEVLGTGTIKPLATFPAGKGSSLDIIVGSNMLSCISASNGSIIWQISSPVPVLYSVLVGDVNQDSTLELVVLGKLTTSPTSGSYIYCYSASTGALIWYGPHSGYYGGITSLELADINNDRKWEVSYSVAGSQYITAMAGMNGSNVWSFHPHTSSYGSIYNMAICDINSDGKLEVIYVIDYKFSKSVFLSVECSQLTGNSWALPPPWPTFGGSTLRTNGYIDFDHDGVPDMLEAQIGTNPSLNDTDADGFLDGEEIMNFTNPLDPLDPTPNHPIANFTANSTLVEPGQAVQFTYTGFAGTEPTTFSWYFGDASSNSSARNPVHWYNTTGIYNVSITVIDSKGKRSAIMKENLITVSIDIPPVVNFTCNATSAFENQPVQFTDLSNDPDGTVVSWQWNFGDSSTNSTMRNPIHVYATPGSYAVALMAIDNRGKKAMISKASYITVIFNQPPIANFTFNATTISKGQAVQFIDLSLDPDNMVVSWHWNFGDGSANSTFQNPVHVYNLNGTYTVKLLITDSFGKKSMIIKVNCITVTGTNETSDMSGDAWPMFHGALNHTGVATTTPAQGTGLTWSYTTNNWVDSSPAVAGGYVYAGSRDANVSCLDVTNGTNVWNYTTGNFVTSSPAIAGGRVYVGSWDHKIYCLNATTGVLAWSYTTGSGVRSSPAVAEGRVYVGSDDGKIYCLDTTTGAFIWSYTTSWPVVSSPAVVGGRVYVGSEDNKIYCLNAATGAFVWSFTGATIYSSPAVADGCVYVGSYDNKLYCLDAITGAHVWNYTTNGGMYSSPAIAGGRVYGGSSDGTYCLNATTGALVWSYANNIVSSSPAIASGCVYVGSEDNKIYCLNATSGDFVWSYTTGDAVLSSPAIAAGHVYAGSNDGKIYCLPMFLTINQTTPTAPRAIHATTGNGQILLTWQAPASDGGSMIWNYTIYQGTTSGGETLLTSVGNVLTFTATNLINGQVYYFKIAAVNVVGEGANSTEASATPSSPPIHLPVLILVFASRNLTFTNPIQLTINITCKDWPVARAWCVVDNLTTLVLARIDGTGISGLYSVTVNMTTGLHDLVFHVNDTHGNVNSKAITIEILFVSPAHNPTNNESAIVIIIIIISGMALVVAIPVSYSRYKRKNPTTKSKKSKSSSYTSNIGDNLPEEPQGMAERSNILEASGMNQPATNVKVALRCTLHKGLIVGPSYTCKYCGAIYCNACINELIDIHKKCWSCLNLLTADDVVLVSPENVAPGENGCTLSVFCPVVIQKINELGINENLIPDLLELLKDVSREDQMQYLENLFSEHEYDGKED